MRSLFTEVSVELVTGKAIRTLHDSVGCQRELILLSLVLEQNDQFPS